MKTCMKQVVHKVQENEREGRTLCFGFNAWEVFSVPYGNFQAKKSPTECLRSMCIPL